MFASLWVLILWGVVMSIFGFQQSYLYSLGGAIIFSLYILYDTSQLMNHLVRRLPLLLLSGWVAGGGAVVVVVVVVVI